MKIKTKKRRAVTSIGIVAIAAIMIGSVMAFQYAEANKHKDGGSGGDSKGANKTMIGEPQLKVMPNTAGWQTIINGTIKTSTSSDLVITHFQECAIHTGLKLDDQSKDLTSVIREDVRLIIDDEIVPASFGDIITLPPDQTDTEGIVTFCGRAFQMETNILEKINALCTNAVDSFGTGGICVADAFFDSYIRTKQTHGWQWVALDVGSGDHKVEIQAKTTTKLDGMLSGSDDAMEEASNSGSCVTNDQRNCVDTVLEVGKRSLIAVEDKLRVGTTLS